MEGELIRAVNSGVYKQVVDTLNINFQDEQGKSALHHAAAGGKHKATDETTDSIQIVEELCKNGADVYLKSNRGITPLHHAASWGRYKILEILIKYASQNNKPYRHESDKNSETPLHFAAYGGKPRQGRPSKVVKKIPMKNYVRTVDLLVKAGEIVDEPNNNGYTPLDIAIEHGHQLIIEKLQELTNKKAKMNDERN